LIAKGPQRRIGELPRPLDTPFAELRRSRGELPIY
jgi:hypothetical protein